MYKKVRHLKKQLNCGDFFALVSMKIEHCTQPIERRGRQENGVEKRGCLPCAAFSGLVKIVKLWKAMQMKIHKAIILGLVPNSELANKI